jgi:8-oxo-dGTP pyrophosphatase MutT (NUDIX family)
MNEIDALAERLRQVLDAGAPGHDAFFAMRPGHPRRKSIAEAEAAGCRRAAALALLYPKHSGAGGDVHILLTERSRRLRRHPGQISLPGGRIDPGEGVVACALREAHEEMGIVSSELTVLGGLTPVYIPPSDYCLFPIMAWAAQRPRLQPHPAEVEATLEVPVALLADQDAWHEEIRTFDVGARRVPYFQVDEHKVWGATALVLSEVATLWRSVAEDGRT